MNLSHRTCIPVPSNTDRLEYQCKKGKDYLHENYYVSHYSNKVKDKPARLTKRRCDCRAKQNEQADQRSHLLDEIDGQTNLHPTAELHHKRETSNPQLYP